MFVKHKTQLMSFNLNSNNKQKETHKGKCTIFSFDVSTISLFIIAEFLILC